MSARNDFEGPSFVCGVGLCGGTWLHWHSNVIKRLIARNLLSFLVMSLKHHIKHYFFHLPSFILIPCPFSLYFTPYLHIFL